MANNSFPHSVSLCLNFVLSLFNPKQPQTPHSCSYVPRGEAVATQAAIMNLHNESERDCITSTGNCHKDNQPTSISAHFLAHMYPDILALISIWYRSTYPSVSIIMVCGNAHLLSCSFSFFVKQEKVETKYI